MAEIIPVYHASATTRRVRERFGLKHSSVNKLLKQHGIRARKRSPSPAKAQRAVELYEFGLSTRTIAEQLGFGGGNVSRALLGAGIPIRSQFRT